MKAKIIKTNELSFAVIYKPLKEGGFDVIFPEIPEICTFGKTLKEAKEMAKDALSCYLESTFKSGEITPLKPPFRNNIIKEKLSVSLALK